MSQLYTCPMHPQIHSDKPGRCSICQMKLVLSDDRGLGKMSWRNYLPLMVIFLMLSVTSLIVVRQVFSWQALILAFMTGFFLVFSGFKLMDLHGFAEGYSTYDLLAKRWFAYGYVYVFLELAFGLLMLAGFHPDWLLWTEFGVMLFSGLGVAIKIAKHEPFQCACLGTFLKVPLTSITLMEDFGMAGLALVVLMM